MVLGNSHMEAVLAALHPTVSRTSIAARLRYFQRRNYPSGDMKVGKGWRIEYGPVDLLKLTLTYELLVAFVPPDEATRMVEKSWSAVEETFRNAVIEMSGRTDVLLLMVVGTGIAAKNEADGSLETVATPNLRRWLQGSGEQRLLTIVDAVRIAKALERALTTGSGEKGTRMMAALRDWASSGSPAAALEEKQLSGEPTTA